MANPNPHQARAAKRRKRGAGSVQELQAVLWALVQQVRDDLEKRGADGEPALPFEVRLKGVHALSQVSGTYLKATEVGELEARLAALEERMKEEHA